MHTTLVSAWNQLLLMFSWAFTEPTAQTFAQLATAWVLATGRRTICGIYLFVDAREGRAHDTYHRFFSQAAWSMGVVWRIWACFVVPRFYPLGVAPLVLDDTLYHKSGRKIDGAAWWRDAVRSTGTRVVYALGLNLVVIALRVDPPWGGPSIGLPIGMRLHRKGGPGPLELAEAMMHEIASWLPEYAFSLAADGFYAPLAGRGFPNTHLVSHMRRDAAIYALPPQRRAHQRGRPRKKGTRLPTPQTMAQCARHWQRVQVNERGQMRDRLIYTRVVLWYTVCPDAPVKLVIVRDPSDQEPDDLFFTTDLEMPPEQVVEAYAGRWCVEDTFKNTKQFIGGEQPQLWREGGPERAAAFSLLLYALVWTWYLLQGHRSIRFRIVPWYPHKDRPSFQDALSALRRSLWHVRIFPRSAKKAAPAKIIRTLIDAAAMAA